MKHLAAKIKRLFRIWQMHFYSNLMRRMAYPVNFFMMAIGVFLQMLLSIVFIDIIFSYIENLSGWTYHQALMVVASYMLIEGLMWGSCAYLNGVTKNVRLGTFDGLIIKPVDTQFFVSVWQSDPEDWVRVITAFFVFLKALSGLELGLLQLIYHLAFYVYLIFNGYLIIYSITMIIRSVSFWTTEASEIWRIVTSITQLSQYPTDIFFHRLIRIFFTVVLPLAFMATVPAKILIGGPLWPLIIGSTLVSWVLFYISRRFFHFGLKHYSSASS